MSSPGTTSDVTVQVEAAELVQAAPALVSALDEDLRPLHGKVNCAALPVGTVSRSSSRGAPLDFLTLGGETP